MLYFLKILISGFAGIAIPLATFSVSRFYRSIDSSYRFHGCMLEFAVRLRMYIQDGFQDGIDSLSVQCSVDSSILPESSQYRDYWKRLKEIWIRVVQLEVTSKDLEDDSSPLFAIRQERANLLDELNHKISQIEGPLKPSITRFISDYLVAKGFSSR